jgi:hypothetical protein
MSESSITYEYITELLTLQDFGKLDELIATNPTIFDTVRSSDGMTLLFWTVVKKRPNFPIEIFLFVLKNTSLETVNERFLGSTLLGDMCERFDSTNRSEIVKALIDKGADPTIRLMFRNKTPLEVAVWNNLHEICKILDPSGLEVIRIKDSSAFKEEIVREYLHYERRCPNPIPFSEWNKSY